MSLHLAQRHTWPAPLLVVTHPPPDMCWDRWQWLHTRFRLMRASNNEKRPARALCFQFQSQYLKCKRFCLKIFIWSIFMPYLVFYYLEKRDIHAWEQVSLSTPRQPTPTTPIAETKEFDSQEAAFAAEVPKEYGFASTSYNGYHYLWSEEEGWVKAWKEGE
ncbi:hypothetical protein [Chromobacterium piscinae]|uniref:hypothetical protein n=1 Tax=Chromobacterium piscinae TaxID=686831 RepID=UPI003F7EC855